MATVVGVHGIFQYKYHSNPDVLAGIWRDALAAAAVPADEFMLAYYSPALHTVTAMGGPSLDDLSPTEHALMVEWLKQVGVPDAVAQGPVTGWLRDGVDWLIRSGRAAGATHAMVGSVLAEIATYTSTTHPEPRRNVHALVGEVIRAQQPRVVVAHSLGSVVAYETLWAEPDLDVPLLVTVGSPLALTNAFYDSFVPPAAIAHTRPPGVQRWVNFADVGDLVAVPKHLSNYFTGIETDETVVIDAFECHKIVPYLTCPPVASVIREGLQP
ncbi:hypothetical protein [Microbacterium sp.]|uniref:hypothetical protein n=1 Tax=Microbacterium sp. TaxID=51671 RepID=UPI0039E42D1C